MSDADGTRRGEKGRARDNDQIRVRACRRSIRSPCSALEAFVQAAV